MSLLRFIVISIFLVGPIHALETSQGAVQVELVVGDLDEPWAIGFLPEDAFLVTTRGGTLWFVNARGQKTRVRGTPEVVVQGQGGLLDVMIPKDFATTREIYLTYSMKQGWKSGTAMGRGMLSADGRRLKNFEKLFEIARSSSGGRHFGSRMVEGRDGEIFMTVGERGDRPAAQDLSLHNGSVLRLTRDGKPAPGNPFIGIKDHQPEIWSYGHRNPQGAALDLAGNLVVNEHGAKGGDEINVIKRGANYGWPVISYGRHYAGGKIGEGTAKAGMEQPALYWDPSIAPSGMMIYSGKLWPEWTGDVFVGSLKFDMISRVRAGANFTEVERIAGDETGRVRDVREGRDGSIWFLSVYDGAVYRLRP